MKSTGIFVFWYCDCCWWWGEHLDVRSVLSMLIWCSVRVSLRFPAALTCHVGKPHDCLCFRSKVCRMHRNILEYCQSHVCFVDPTSLVLWLADLTSPDLPMDLVPLVTKGLWLPEENYANGFCVCVCVPVGWNRLHFILMLLVLTL
jgi:hypothetical protein